MRAATLARLGLGGVLLAAPGRALDLAGGPDRHEERVRMAARMLGGRLVLQAAADAVLGARLRVLGMAVELGHAASMVAVVAVSDRHRRTASVSAGLATGLLLLDVYPGHFAGLSARRRPHEAGGPGHRWS